MPLYRGAQPFVGLPISRPVELLNGAKSTGLLHRLAKKTCTLSTYSRAQSGDILVGLSQPQVYELHSKSGLGGEVLSSSK